MPSTALRHRRTLSAVALAAVMMVLAPSRTAVAHEVPANVAVQAYIRPAGSTLTVLVRVPLESMRDVDFPLRGPGYLELEGLGPFLNEAAGLWIADYLRFYEDDVSLAGAQLRAARVSLPSNRSFRSYEEALDHVTGPPLPPSTEIVWNQALLDVLFEVPITSESARFATEPALAHLGVETVSVLHFLPPGGGERVFQYRGNPGLVHLDPRWHQAALRFVWQGVLHILGGLDHLLFVLCLVIPFRRLGRLVPIVTAFTVAHSITLVASALGVVPTGLWFPPLVETLIAMSIVYMALENILGARLHRRWVVAFAFGLVHGFGFAFVLGESLQFAGSHLLTSLLSFNLGVELGQIAVLVVAIPLLELAFRKGVAERMGIVILSALIAHSGWHWMTDRGSQLLQYRISRPPLNAELLAALLQYALLAAICAGAAWGLAGLFARLPGGRGNTNADQALDPHVT